ncbi:MAG: hypothetical protein Q4D77_08725 [Peptostreptococcaceae bacterium]|nr:hypothetical protein [Peptostreptococcaceae bacterium]
MKKVFSIALVGLITAQFSMEGYAVSKHSYLGNSQPIAIQNNQNSGGSQPQEVAGADVTESDAAQPDIAPTKDPSQISKELLQEILIDIKKRLVINDENAKLTYSMGSESGQTYYELLWESDKYTQSVRYGEDKNIYNYSYRKNTDHVSEKMIKKLPQYSEKESRTIASDFISKAFPKEYKNFRQVDQSEISGENYIFGFEYHKDDILVLGTNAYVTVNYITGKVTGFSTDYVSNIQYEDLQGIIDGEAAQDAYRQEIGLKKIYTYQYNDEKLDIYNVRMAYVPGLDGYSINAKTGKKEYVDSVGFLKFDTAEDRAVNAEGDSIQPLEELEIEKKSGLKSLEEAKSEALALKLFDNEGFEMSYANLYERHYSSSNYVWSLSFDLDGESYSIELDAKTLEPISFFDYTGFGNYEKITKEHIDSAKKAAREFIKKYASDHEIDLQLDEEDLERALGTQNDVVRMYFKRYEGGAYVPADGIYINYMPSKSRITYFSLYWSDLRLPKPTKFADEELIFKKIFEENELKLGYKFNWDDKNQKYNAKLYYYVDENKELPLRFSITTGDRIFPVDPIEKIREYEDISLSKYEIEAEKLYQIGIGFSGGYLKPTMPISKEELLDLIASAFDTDYYPIEPYVPADSRAKTWTRLGLVAEGEIVGDGPLTREDVAKYLVRSLGYEKIAAKKEIFKSSLYDFDQVSNGYQGYIAIAEALRILDVSTGGEFHPQEHATRDDAIKMLYNFLAFQ